MEYNLSNLRWLVLAGAALYLVFSNRAQNLFLGAGTVLLGVALNAAVAYLLHRHLFAPTWGVAMQVADTLLLLVYTSALRGGLRYHLPLYTTMIIISTIRLGLLGAICSGLVGILLNALATVVLTGDSPAMSVVWVSTVADTVLLAYFAYLIWQEQLARQRDEGELRRKVQEITVLHEVSNIVHDLKSEDALQNIVKITTQVMGFQRAGLFLTANVGDMIPRRYYSRSQEAEETGLPDLFIADDLFASLLTKDDMPIVVDGSQGSPDMARGPILQVAVPLHGHEAPIGVLIADRGKVSQSDKDMLLSLAQSAVMAIENASLHRQVKRMANHDGVTDLFNHRYFQEALRAALHEAGKKWPVSLLMIEIDQFKRYNDTFGHRQGDTALISLARALETSTQSQGGLVARYGGDEFVVILPHIGQAEGIQVARAVHAQACQLVENALREHNLPGITLSVGVATYPDDAEAATDLIDAADRAMYVVKHSGGNRVNAYSK